MSIAIVTGATGFLGSHLLRRLLREGWEVVALKRSNSQIPQGIDANAKLRWFDADQSSGIKDAFDATPTVDAVFHLAASYARNDEPPSKTAQTNFLFPLRVLEIALQREVKLFVSTDSCFTLDYPYLLAYTLSKKQFTEWGRILSSKSSMRFVNLELQHPFGPGDQPWKFVPWIIQQCNKDHLSIALTSGEQRKDFIYVDDVIDAYFAIVSHENSLATGFHHFECGRGEAFALRKFVEIVHRACKSNCTLDFGALPYRDNEIMYSAADTTRLRELGWALKWSLEDGIANTISEHLKAIRHN